MLPATHTQVRKTVHWYIRKKVPFIYEMQNETLTVKSEAGSYTTKSKEYTIDEINFIKEVKKHIIDNGLYDTLRHLYNPNKKVLYFKYSKNLSPGDYITDCINIDIEGAYWNTAYKFGLLSEGIYQKGLKHRKQVRLSAIGSLAKKKRVYEYDGATQKLLYVKINEKTAYLWDVICDHVAQVMQDVQKQCGKDFIFFWVDGIYVKNSSEEKVKSLFLKKGFKCKSDPLKAIEIKKSTTYVHLINPKKRIRKGIEIDVWHLPFPFRNEKVSNEFSGYNRDL